MKQSLGPVAEKGIRKENTAPKDGELKVLELIQDYVLRATPVLT